MKPDKKFYKCPGIVVSIAVLLLAALAMPAAVAMTSRTKTQPKPVGKQNEEELSRLTAKLVRLASVEPAAITVEKLADICEAMESAIVDISVEYEWYVESPSTLEEKLEYIAGKGLLVDVNIPRYKFSAAGLLSKRDPNELLPERLLFEESSTVMNADGNTWDSVIKESYNGKIYKSLQIGGWPGESRSGSISYKKRFMLPMVLTPLGFSVLRLSFSKVAGNEPLSAVLRHKEFVHLDNTVEKVNGFNTIRADFLIRSDDPNMNKMLYLRVYFSVDHGYTPIKYEHMRGGKKVAFAFEVHSLEQVAEGLWFPSSGRISAPDDEEMNVYRATSKIVINQGLTDEHFDIEFPRGTEVWDEIRDTEYIVKPTKEQKEKFEKEKQWEKEHADEIAAMEKEGGRIYSAGRLMSLGTAKQLYMADNDREFPQTLDDLKIYFSGKDEEIFSWLLKNVEYLGKGKTAAESLDTVLAYDKTLLKKGEGTNVLFLNGFVKFCRPEELGKLGINDSEDAQVE